MNLTFSDVENRIMVSLVVAKGALNINLLSPDRVVDRETCSEGCFLQVVQHSARLDLCECN